MMLSALDCAILAQLRLGPLIPTLFRRYPEYGNLRVLTDGYAVILNCEYESAATVEELKKDLPGIAQLIHAQLGVGETILAFGEEILERLALKLELAESDKVTKVMVATLPQVDNSASTTTEVLAQEDALLSLEQIQASTGMGIEAQKEYCSSNGISVKRLALMGVGTTEFVAFGDAKAMLTEWRRTELESLIEKDLNAITEGFQPQQTAEPEAEMPTTEPTAEPSEEAPTEVTEAEAEAVVKPARKTNKEYFLPEGWTPPKIYKDAMKELHEAQETENRSQFLIDVTAENKKGADFLYRVSLCYDTPKKNNVKTGLRREAKKLLFPAAKE